METINLNKILLTSIDSSYSSKLIMSQVTIKDLIYNSSDMTGLHLEYETSYFMSEKSRCSFPYEVDPKFIELNAYNISLQDSLVDYIAFRNSNKLISELYHHLISYTKVITYSHISPLRVIISKFNQIKKFKYE